MQAAFKIWFPVRHIGTIPWKVLEKKEAWHLRAELPRGTVTEKLPTKCQLLTHDCEPLGTGELEAGEPVTHPQKNPDDAQRRAQSSGSGRLSSAGPWEGPGGGQAGGLQGTTGPPRLTPHHPFQGVGDLGGLVQELAVLQLLAQPLQRVQGLVQLHRHGHFGQVFPDVVPQDVPQADGAGAGARGRQASSSLGLGFSAAFKHRPWKGIQPRGLQRTFYYIT